MKRTAFHVISERKWHTKHVSQYSRWLLSMSEDNLKSGFKSVLFDTAFSLI